MDCLFCKIIAKEIPCHKVYEDDYVLAFLDIHPCAKGHTVVVPKKHIANLTDFTKQEFNFMAQGLFDAHKKVKKILNPDGVNTGINDGAAAGQAIAHAHWHIIPRWSDDGGGSMHSVARPAENINVEQVALLFL